MEKSEYIYFEPQTGIIKSFPIRSNFYIYRLRADCKDRVESVVANESFLVAGGFAYPADFLFWLKEQDTKWDQQALNFND